MKKTSLTILAVFTALFLVAFTTVDNEKSANKTNTEHVISVSESESGSNYCRGWYEGYKDGWEEECGGGTTYSTICTGDVSDCKNTYDPYKGGYSLGFKKGTKDGIKRCGW